MTKTENEPNIHRKMSMMHDVRFESTDGEIIGEEIIAVQDCVQKFIHRILICSSASQLLTLDCKTKYNHPLQKNLHDVVSSKS